MLLTVCGVFSSFCLFLAVGYIEAAVIPAGARRIRVVEDKPAHSFLGKKTIKNVLIQDSALFSVKMTILLVIFSWLTTYWNILFTLRAVWPYLSRGFLLSLKFFILWSYVWNFLLSFSHTSSYVQWIFAFYTYLHCQTSALLDFDELITKAYQTVFQWFHSLMFLFQWLEQMHVPAVA